MRNAMLFGSLAGIGFSVIPASEAAPPPEPEPEPTSDTEPEHLQRMADAGLPLDLSSDIRSVFYHPSCLRVGVKIDGEIRNDITEYHARSGEYRTQGQGRAGPPKKAKTVEAYWRHEESRQQRRARERWEAKHGR